MLFAKKKKITDGEEKLQSNSQYRVKVLIGIIGKADEKKYEETINENCISINYSGLAFGTAKSSYLAYLGLDDIEKRIEISLIPEYSEKQVLKALRNRLKLYLTGKGIAFTMPLAGISGLISDCILKTPVNKDERTDNQNNSNVENNNEREKKMNERQHDLLVAVVSQKYTDRVLESARAAGATGASILHTRSLNNEKAEQVLGTTLKTETDTIFFLVAKQYKAGIMEAIKETGGLKTDGGAVIFSLPVDAIAGIGRFDTVAEGNEADEM